MTYLAHSQQHSTTARRAHRGIVRAPGCDNTEICAYCGCDLVLCASVSRVELVGELQ